MKSSKQTVITKDLPQKQLIVNRQFEAPIQQVWNAWTNSDFLDLWWAPKPWKAKTKTMDFRAGGYWLYAMIGPDGTQVWGRVDYDFVTPLEHFSGTDAFCNETGEISNEMPAMHWKCFFKELNTATSVHVEITFASEADLEKIIEMGFAEGFTAAHTNLDELLLQSLAEKV